MVAAALAYWMGPTAVARAQASPSSDTAPQAAPPSSDSAPQAAQPSSGITTTTKGGSDDLTQPPDAGLPSDPNDRLQELERRIAGADARQGDLLAQIDQSDMRRRQLDGVVADLERQVGDLNSQLIAVHKDLDRTTSAYVAAERDVEDAQERLAAAKDRVQRRAAEVYKEGPGELANFVLGAHDVEDAANRVSYVRRVVQSDRAAVDALGAADRDYRVRSARLDGLKTEQLGTLNRIAAVQEQINGNLARQRNVRDQVAAETNYKKAVLAKVQSDRASWQALVARQQQESSSIADLLAQYENGQGVPTGVVAGMFTLPVNGEVTSVFGWRVHPIFGTSRFHSGIDLAVDEGTPIRAPADGVVVSASWMGGYGNATVIDHGSHIATLYGHQSRFGVSAGQSVHRGDVIGYVGSTGYSTGPHLHFEVRVNGEPVDPVPWLRAA